MMDVGRLFGRGIGFPPQLDKQSRLAWSEGADNIRQSIRIILSTEPGERLMLPNFGAGLKRFLFEPNNVVTHRLIEERILQSMELWEPRVKVDSVDIITDEQDPQAVWVMLRYTLISNQSSDQLQLKVQLAG